MAYYVTIGRLNDRQDMYNLAKRLDEREFSDNVEYFAGGWMEDARSYVGPHLLFQDNDEALVYVLSYGGTVTSHLPFVGPEDY